MKIYVYRRYVDTCKLGLSKVLIFPVHVRFNHFCFNIIKKSKMKQTHFKNYFYALSSNKCLSLSQLPTTACTKVFSTPRASSGTTAAARSVSVTTAWATFTGAQTDAHSSPFRR